ncbi:MAG TPA: hypothetical protein VHF89_07025 [Solirubrobacteraceae bacterium]|nr:hypothetical protein [Solirubrobacteraceae bacterium]
MNRPRRDESVPTLLIVSLAGIIVAVVGVAALAQTPTTPMVLLALTLLLAGLVAVTATLDRQLDDADGRAARRRESADSDLEREA